MTNIILLIGMAGMIIGFFNLISLSPMDFVDGIFKGLVSKPKNLRDKVNEETRSLSRKLYNNRNKIRRVYP